MQYQNEPHHILLQNENGPCPLLAAANCLLLKKSIVLPSNCIGAGVVTIEELTNILVDKILTNNHGCGDDERDHHIDEVIKIFPKLQFGMDVNPKFTAGPRGVEYTLELNAFDLLRIDLVHGWLLEPDAQEYELVGNNTYNQLVNVVIEGNDASATLQQASADIDIDELSNKATRGAIVRGFLERSAHQLTQHGLFVLHEFVKEGDMVVFFRNNHFNTLTKQRGGSLYLLVTDFGYANVGSVVWEKLDVIDGDTEYVTADFAQLQLQHQQQQYHHVHVSGAATGEQLVANDARSRADYQLALQLSREQSTTNDDQRSSATNAAVAAASVAAAASVSAGPHPHHHHHPSEDAAIPTVAVGIPIGMGDNVVSHSQSHSHSQEDRDRMLAMELQRQEEERAEEREQARLQQQQQQQREEQQRRNKASQQRSRGASKGLDCVIS
eukprot:jgi/Psemu1/244652/estExt_Genewise1.C_4850031